MVLPVVNGAGLGLRRGLLTAVLDSQPSELAFLEVTPENWIGVGGRWGKQFRRATEAFPCVAHGLSLSLGGPDPLDTELLRDLRAFLTQHNVLAYSEHLSYCCAGGHLYDLMPIPFTEEAVHWTASRIREAQDRLGQRIAVENVSYYAAPHQAMTELQFINAVLTEADCLLLLDVNNILVNSVNHQYDPHAFLRGLPFDRVAWCHVAGHSVESATLRIDTHGAAVISPVWDLLAEAYQAGAVFPTVLERDFNYPPFADLLTEVDMIRQIQQEVRDRVSGAGYVA